jgi:hypothetical protein
MLILMSTILAIRDPDLKDTYGPVPITKGYPSSCQGPLGYPLCSDDIVYRRSSDKMPIDDTNRR